MSKSELTRLRSKGSRRIIGLNSGTSMDGIDAMAVVISGSGRSAHWDVVSFDEYPMPAQLSALAQQGETLTRFQINDLDHALGQVFADAATSIARKAQWGRVDLVGSHGQTVLHLPGDQHTPTQTIQLGQPQLIADQLSTIVVSNFRVADCAAGGHGAPLIPYLDAILFPDGPVTAAINLGGIANLTSIAQGSVETAYDIGPANLPLNELALIVTDGQESFDRNGDLARGGQVIEPILSNLLQHPFFSLQPPRTTGREMFGTAFIRDLIDSHPTASVLDLLSTATEWIAQTVAAAALRSCADRAVISGGGALNTYLMERLARALGSVPLSTSAAFGIDPLAKEALLFALLANDRIFDLPTNIPAATGAGERVLLGEITA